MESSDNQPSFAGRKALILGGDGFCGWPTALRMSALGADVTIVDNGSRRRIDTELGSESLTDISSLSNRVEAWREVSGQQLGVHHLDIVHDYTDLVALLRDLQPDLIVHFAEQRSAPYSMLTSEGARYSVDNNIRGTHNLLSALVEAKVDPHLIHLGTIGVYGYSTAGLKLPEGYLSVKARGADDREVEKEILYPGEPDSIYHLTKFLDQQLFAFYVRLHGLRITDLHQGVVWGTQTVETRRDRRLVNRFDHDAVYGTVVNRFIVQAIKGLPLTVYGSGSQTRAFIHIEDVLTCICLASGLPPKTGERVRILNQVGESSSINALASRVSEITGVALSHVKNPRREPEGNEFDVDRSTFRDLGFTPRTFENALEAEIADLSGLLAEPQLAAAD